jgi:hypothetical protein
MEPETPMSNSRSSGRVVAWMLVIATASFGTVVEASTIGPSDTRSAASPGGPVGAAPNYAVSRSWAAPPAIVGSTSQAFGNAFGAGDSAIIPLTTAFGAAYSFYDNYVFTVGPSVANASATTITLGVDQGIDGLEARLYKVGAPGATSGTLYYGSVPGGAYQGWTLVTGAVQTAVITAATLDPGTWTLEIRGRTLSGGGSYGGSLNISPVPVPPAAGLLLGGIAMLGAFRRRPKTALAVAA